MGKHTHRDQGQALRHDHAGGSRPHGYFEHPEDGSRATDTESTAPVADALAEVDRRQNTSGQNGELTALRALAEAVRSSLTEFSETDVRALAVTAGELYRNDYKGTAEEYLSERQFEVLGRARELFGDGS